LHSQAIYMHRHPRVCILFSLALLSACGCGLRDYESKIDDRRYYLALYDEENKYLNSVGVSAPREKIKGATKNYWPNPLDIYLKVPKEISTTLQEKDGSSAYFQGDPPSEMRLFRYGAGRDYAVFVALGFITPAVKEKGKNPRPQEWPIAAFRDQVRGALMDYCRKELRHNPTEIPLFDRNTSKTEVAPPSPERTGSPLPAVSFDSLAFYVTLPPSKNDTGRTLQYRFEAYFHQEEGRQAAVIYQMPKSFETDDDYRKANEWSLKSFAIDPNTVAARRNR
jgi:hypothetical protein